MKKTYAVSDLHGCMNLYEQIKGFINPEDTVYFLGDATDRGPQPWELAKVIYNDPQFIYLKGNHEDMLVKAALHYYGDEWDSEDNYYVLTQNGGIRTWKEMSDDPEGMEYIKLLKMLPRERVYINAAGKKVHLSHAGFTPGRKRDVLWDRKHFHDILDENADNIIVVHGHTPVCYQRGYKTTRQAKTGIYPEVYANGHKINIDMGAFFTNACVLLDLDTFEYHVFTIKD